MNVIGQLHVPTVLPTVTIKPNKQSGSVRFRENKNLCCGKTLTCFLFFVHGLLGQRLK